MFRISSAVTSSRSRTAGVDFSYAIQGVSSRPKMPRRNADARAPERRDAEETGSDVSNDAAFGADPSNFTSRSSASLRSRPSPFSSSTSFSFLLFLFIASPPVPPSFLTFHRSLARPANFSRVSLIIPRVSRSSSARAIAFSEISTIFPTFSECLP